MSIANLISALINEKFISPFIEAISSKYEIDNDDLHSTWNEISNGDKTTTVVRKTVEKPKPLEGDGDIELLRGMSKAELTSLCKARGFKTTGTKDQLIGALTGKSVEPAKPAAKTAASKAKQQQAPPTPPVKKVIQASVPTIQLRRNDFGNCEHRETGLVFDTDTKQVIGKQNKDGTIDSLTDEDIDTCNKYKFLYVIPTNLDRNKSDLKHVEVEELDAEDYAEGEDDLELEDEEIEDEEEIPDDEEY